MDQWLPAEVRQFYETQMGTLEKTRAVLGDPAQCAEWEHVNDLMMDAYQTWLRQGYRKIPCPQPVHLRSGEGTGVRARRRPVRQVRLNA